MFFLILIHHINQKAAAYEAHQIQVEEILDNEKKALALKEQEETKAKNLEMHKVRLKSSKYFMIIVLILHVFIAVMLIIGLITVSALMFIMNIIQITVNN